MVGVDGVLLRVRLACQGGLHEAVVYLDRHVGPGHLAAFHLGVDEGFGVGVLDAHGEHEGAAPPVLRHFAGGVGVAFHERHEPGGGEGRVLHGRAFGADVRQVVPYAAAPLHELHLFLVHLDDGPVGVGVLVEADDKAVGQRGHLVVVADAGHGASLRHDVAEVAEQLEQFVFAQRVGVAFLNPGNFPCQAAVHVVRCQFVGVAERIFQGILVCPYSCRKVVAFEVFQGGVVDLLLRIGFLFHCNNCFDSL